MKYLNIVFTALAAVMIMACQPNEEVIFGVDLGSEDGMISVGPEGGVKKIAEVMSHT